MEKLTNFSQSSINELTIHKLSIHELTIDKLTIGVIRELSIDEPSKASQENAVAEIAELSEKNPPAIQEHSQENPEGSAPESTITINELSISIPESSLQENASDDIAEPPEIAVSAIDEAAQESPISIPEDSKEDPEVDVLEENPESTIAIDEPSISIAEVSQEHPSSEIPESSPQEKPSVHIAEVSEENPPEFPEISQENASVEIAESRPQENASDDIAEPPENNLPDMDEASISIAEVSEENPSSEIFEFTAQEKPSVDIPSKISTDGFSCSEDSAMEILVKKTQLPCLKLHQKPQSPELPETEIAEKPSVDITEAPAENPSNNNDINFLFEIKPARRLKLAMEALSDLEFNPLGIGRIDVNEKGFGITVINRINFFGHLWLKATGAQSFRCSKPMMGKLVDVRQISQNLVADDQDTVTISHTQGSNKICFTIGGEPTREFTAVFLRYGTISEFPEVEIFCQAAVTVKDLEVVIERLFDKDGMPQIVTVDMMKKKALILVGMQKILFYEYDKMRVDGTNGMVDTEQRHNGKFYWPHPAVLKKAARLLPALIVSFTSKPPQNIMLRFTLQEHGELMFLKKAFSLVTNLQDIHKIVQK